MPIAADAKPPAWTQWEFVDALGDGVYGVDPQGSCIFVNKAALRMLGYHDAGELLGRNMHEVIHHTRPDGSAFPQAECPLLHTTISGHPVRLENEMLWRRDGTPFLAEYSSFPVVTGTAIAGCVITFSDAAIRRDAQTRLAVQYTVSQVLSGSAADQAMLHRLLEAIGTGLHWDVGLFWRRSDDGSGHDVLRCVADWQSRDARQSGAFGVDSRGETLGLAAGLPGTVWKLETAIHVADLLAHPPSTRQLKAAELGLRSALAFPVVDGTTVVGAIEFYSRRAIAIDESLLEAVATLGQQIGQSFKRRSVELALTESERRKAAILSLSPDCVITVDAAGHVVEFNDTAERVFGHSAAEALGQDLVDMIFPEEDRAAHRRAFARGLAGDTAVLGRRLELDAIRADGSRFPIEFSMSKTADAPRTLFTGYLRDITVRRRDQLRLRESEARFRTIVNAIPQLAWMTDAMGAVIWYNARWYDYTGTTFEEMAGWGWRSVHHPNHIERVEQRLRESFSAGADWEDTFPLRARDGTYSWFLSRAQPIREEPDSEFPDGRLIGWFGSNTDVTQMREVTEALEAARDEAEAANLAKSTFIANMSHELRTPLSAIIGYAEMVVEEIGDGADPTELSGDIGKIEGNARHLLGLINDVLDLSKVESGKMEAYVEPFDVAEMVHAVVATVGTLMEKNDNRIELRMPDGLGTMRSDVTRVRQVLLNLLSNAAKFTETGTVTLAVEREPHPAGDWLRFAVTDTGIGMTEEQLAKLFQRFQQADASTTRQFGGTGLGLSLTKAFATLLGGEILVASVPGQGSTFTVRVPAVLDPAAPPAPADETGPDLPAGRDVVLVVDDDQAQLDIMSRFLVREGYAARTASDGPTGLALAKQLKPRAILLDVTMPGMDGWSVLGALKADPDVAAIPVVMVTFHSERPLAASLGAADYVLKPVDWNRLRYVMERFREAEGDVLLVENDEATRQRTRQVLEKNGWSVVEAENGRVAMDQVAYALPRVILLDLNMPVMDGFEFLAELRRRPGCGAIPVVVLTAMDLTAEDRRRLRGANQVLNKGDVTLQDLAEKLRQLGLDGAE